MMYNRVPFQGGGHGGGGGNYMQQMKQDKKLAERKEARKGNFKDTDAMYNFLVSGAEPTYREENFRDIEFQDYHKALGKDSLAYKDANTYKSAILKAGDPRGIFTGKITDPRYGTPIEVALSQSYLDHFNRMTSALGFDPAGMASGVQPQPVLSTFPGANPQSTGIAAAAAQPAQPVLSAADRGYKPFMTIDEGENYYGQFANGGVVPNTLRRKMFSMGGKVPGYHGVGITSGMQYNKGGSVQATYGVGNNAMKKTGPDGRQREAHYAGIVPILKGIGNIALGGIPKLFNRQAMKYGYKGADKLKDYMSKNKKALEAYRKQQLKKFKGDAAKADDAVNKYALQRAGVDEVGKVQKFIDRAAPAVYLGGAGEAALERAGVIDPERTKLEQALSYAGAPLDYLSIPGYATMIAQGALDEPGTESEVETLTDLISGRERTEKGDTSDIDSPSVDNIVQRISEEDQLRQDFAARKALYQELMASDEETNNLGVLGNSLLQMSETLNQGKGMISAGNVFGTSLAEEVARRDERATSIRDAAATQAITDVMAERSLDQATMNEALAAGDVSIVRTMQGIDQAQAAGIPLEKVPTEDDGQTVDVDALNKRPGTVFIDPDNVVGKGFFVAVNSRGEKASFNDVQAAIQFAES